MNKKKITYLVIVLAILGIIAIILNLEKSSTYKLEEKLFKVDSANVDKIELERNSKKLVLEKAGIGWQLTSPVKYIAYQPFISTALGEIKNMKLISIASKNKENKDKFGFNDTNYTKVVVYQGGSLVGSFIIGNALPSAAQVYVKKIEGDEIYVADGIVYNTLVKNEFINEWREKKMLSISKTTIKSIKFTSPEETYELTKDTTGNFRLGNDSINTTQVDGVVNLFQDFNTQTFKDTTIADDSKSDYIINIKSDNDIVIKFFKYGDSENPRYMIKISGNPQVFDIDKNFFGTIFKKKKDLIVSK